MTDMHTRQLTLTCTLLLLSPTACSSDESCPPNTLVKVGDCAEAHAETGGEDDPPADPDPYHDTPQWDCNVRVLGEQIAQLEIDQVQDIFGGVDSKDQVEACPWTPDHHVGDPWPAEPYPGHTPEMPETMDMTFDGLDDVRSRQISNFGVYLGPVPTNHPRAPTYSPLYWQIGNVFEKRSRYNITGSPCSTRSHLNGLSDYEENQDCAMRALSPSIGWGTQPDWPHFPPAYDLWTDGDEVAAENSVCLADSQYYTFALQAPDAVASVDTMRGLTYVNGAFFQEFAQDVLGGFLEANIGVDLGNLADQLSVWIDGVFNWGYWPNCDPNDAYDVLSPSVHCAAWSHTGVCSYAVSVAALFEFYYEWRTIVPCPTPYVGILPPFSLDVQVDGEGLAIPGQHLEVDGWCQQAFTLWTPGGAAIPPPDGEFLDVIQLPLEETGFHRGYLVNFDRVTADTLLTWSGAIELTSSPRGVVLTDATPDGQGAAVLAQFGLEAGDVVNAIGQVTLEGADTDDLITAVNDAFVEGRIVSALVLRGDLALPTYIGTARYR